MRAAEQIITLLGSAAGSIGPTPGTPVLTWTSDAADLTPDGTVAFDNVPLAGDTITSQIQVSGGDWSSSVLNNNHVITADEDLVNQASLSNSSLTAGSYDWRVRITHNGAPSDWSNVETKTLTGFSPSSLTPNAWFEPAAGGMFQKSDGTTAANTSGQSVAYLPDLSGNGFHLTTVTTTLAPSDAPLLQSVGANPYLSFDGTNDVLRRASALGSWTAGATSWFFAIRSGTLAAQGVLAGEFSSVSASPFYMPGTESINSSPFTTAIALIRDDAANSSGMPFNTSVQTGVFDGSDHVFGIVDSGTSITPYLDGVAGTPVAYTRGTHVLTVNLFSLGALVRSSNPNGGSFMPMRLHGAVMVNRVLTAGEITNLTTYLGALQGRSI